MRGRPPVDARTGARFAVRMSGYDKSPDYGGGGGGWKVAVLAALLFVAIAGVFILPALFA